MGSVALEPLGCLFYMKNSYQAHLGSKLVLFPKYQPLVREKSPVFRSFSTYTISRLETPNGTKYYIKIILRMSTFTIQTFREIGLHLPIQKPQINIRCPETELTDRFSYIEDLGFQTSKRSDLT